MVHSSAYARRRARGSCKESLVVVDFLAGTPVLLVFGESVVGGCGGGFLCSYSDTPVH